MEDSPLPHWLPRVLMFISGLWAVIWCNLPMSIRGCTCLNMCMSSNSSHIPRGRIDCSSRARITTNDPNHWVKWGLNLMDRLMAKPKTWTCWIEAWEAHFIWLLMVNIFHDICLNCMQTTRFCVCRCVCVCFMPYGIQNSPSLLYRLCV
jgi:hypothetical protein